MDDEGLSRDEPNIKDEAKDRKMEGGIQRADIAGFKIKKIHDEEREIEERAEERDRHAKNRGVWARENGLAAVQRAWRNDIGEMLDGQVRSISKAAYGKDCEDRHKPLMVWSSWRRFECL